MLVDLLTIKLDKKFNGDGGHAASLFLADKGSHCRDYALRFPFEWLRA